MADLNQDSPLHLADALADEIANTPAQTLLGEVTEDLGHRRALASEFDTVVARALRQSRRKQLATAAKSAGVWLSQSLFRKPVLARVGALAVLIIAVAGYHYRGEQPAVPRIESLNLQARSPQQQPITPAPSFSAFSKEDAADRLASAEANSPAPPIPPPSPPVQSVTAAAPRPAAVNAAAAVASAKSAPLLVWPVQGRVVAGFGARTTALADPSAPAPTAEGIAIAVPEGADIRAAADGTVSYVGPDQRNGKFLLIRHDDDLKTGYGHVRTVLVKVSDQVHRGEVIAKGVVTSRSAEPQLYFEVRRGTAPIDPMQYLPRDQ